MPARLVRTNVPGAMDKATVCTTNVPLVAPFCGAGAADPHIDSGYKAS